MIASSLLLSNINPLRTISDSFLHILLITLGKVRMLPFRITKWGTKMQVKAIKYFTTKAGHNIWSLPYIRRKSIDFNSRFIDPNNFIFKNSKKTTRETPTAHTICSTCTWCSRADLSWQNPCWATLGRKLQQEALSATAVCTSDICHTPAGNQQI